MQILRFGFIFYFFSFISICYADTVAGYMSIAENLPRMEMKADAESQAWSRSARNVLLLTCETVWDGLKAANQTALQQGKPLFCPPANRNLSAEEMLDMINDTYKQMSLTDEEKNQMSIAQLAFIGLQKKFACKNSTTSSNEPNITVAKTQSSMVQKMIGRMSY